MSREPKIKIKIICILKGFQIAKMILKKKKKLAELILSDSKIYYKPVVITQLVLG